MTSLSNVANIISDLLRITRSLRTWRASTHPQVTMKRSTLSSSFVYFSLCCIVHVVISARAGCDESQCRAPMQYYRDVGCTPVYANEDSCCPYKYDCQHLEGRSTDKCYYKGHEYALGEHLRAEDASPCDIGCTCAPGYLGPARFRCVIVDCFARASPGCHLQRSHDKCCSRHPEICPAKDPDVFKCEVDGTTYYQGQGFAPKAAPELSCICSEGYTGQNVEPWCKTPEPVSCKTELHHTADILLNCTPVYYSHQNPATDCSLSYRCQNKDDEIVEAEADAKALFPDDANSDLKCKFGNMTMSRGEQLNMATDWSSVCVKCVCEVPPLPTCQRLPDDKCDITKHPDFYNMH